MKNEELSEAELIQLAFGGLTPEYRDRLLADLAKSDGRTSEFGWHEFLPPEIIVLWPKLNLDHRIIAFLAAEFASGFRDVFEAERSRL